MRLQIAGSRVQITVGSYYIPLFWTNYILERTFRRLSAILSSVPSHTMRRAPIRQLNALRRRNIHTHDLTGRESSVKVTTLPNKIRIATENTPGHFAALGLYVDAGSRYETSATSGVSHFLDRMAFKVCVLHFCMLRYLI